MAQIAIGGFGHETNSFITHRADFAYFAEHRDRPPLVRGAELFNWLSEGSMPISGFIARMRGRHDLIPLVWAHGSAGGTVTDNAFERIVGELIGRLSEASSVDGVYLDLHGAMVTETFEDAEGELLRRVRATVGDVPIVVSLDYHANITPQMVGLSDGMVAFLTYPHIDRPQTGERAARIMSDLLERGRPKGRAIRNIPFLIPAPAQCTMAEPSRSIVAESKILHEGIVDLTYAAGFPLADLYWCGPAVACHARTQEFADAAVDRLARMVMQRESEFVSSLLSPREGVRRAMEVAATADKPIVIADLQDNPGGGGSGDTTGILAELLAADAEGAVVGIFCDAEAARAAHDAGEGAEIDLALGGRSGPEGVQPIQGKFRVKRLGSGKFRTTGAVAGGLDADLGPMALLSIAGIDIVVSSKRMQAMDQAPFQHLGVEPARKKILVLKSTVHFRAEFEPIAQEVLLVAAPGVVCATSEAYPFKRLRPELRLNPNLR
jgi:microcystin degradation protein MlrC